MMKKNCVLMLALMLLAGCAPQGALKPGEAFETRDLTPQEKQALAPMIEKELKDPESARFKWMPVVLRSRDGITDYCGMVNARNSFGGYTGYMRFYGQLVKDKQGRFTFIEVRFLEVPESAVNIFEPNWPSRGICDYYGYTDFNLAH